MSPLVLRRKSIVLQRPAGEGGGEKRKRSRNVDASSLYREFSTENTGNPYHLPIGSPVSMVAVRHVLPTRAYLAPPLRIIRLYSNTTVNVAAKVQLTFPIGARNRDFDWNFETRGDNASAILTPRLPLVTCHWQ